MRKILAAGVVTTALVASSFALPSQPARAQGQTATGTTAAQTFIVLYGSGASAEQARAAITAAGGRLVKENTAVGVATVTTTNANFRAAANRQGALAGVATNRVIGSVPRDKAPSRNDIERAADGPAGASGASSSAKRTPQTEIGRAHV